MNIIKDFFNLNIIYIVVSLSSEILGGYWFDVVPLKQILSNNPSIKYIKCTDKIACEVPKYQIEPLMPNKVIFDELFILSIPDGKVQGRGGYTLIGDKYIKEFYWCDQPYIFTLIPKIPDDQVIKISGRVAVVSTFAHYNFFHFVTEVLSRLALLEMHHIEYDWLYIPYDIDMIKKFLTLWGIDPRKIISPTDNNFCIQADELIVPSLFINTNRGFNERGVFTHPYALDYIRNKLIMASNLQAMNNKGFSEYVFISRLDTQRHFLNEDEIFKLFEPLGFVSYQLSKMTLEEQISLFQNAKVVIGEHGAGLGNILFCKPGTMVIELYEKLIDFAMWWLAGVCNLNLFDIKTLDCDSSYVLNFRNYDMSQCYAGYHVPLNNIYPIVEMLKERIKL